MGTTPAYILTILKKLLAAELIIAKIPSSKNAEYNADVMHNVTRGPCTPETRVDVLDILKKWSKSEGSQICWLNGVAGCGKTTVAHSFCLKMQEKKRLGASFFCSRSLGDCRNIKLIIPTISHQLAQRFPQFKKALVDILQRDSNICQKTLDTQLRGLIIEPSGVKKRRLPSDIVVVIDALDECDGSHSAFLEVLFTHATQLPFKLLITSRPDYPIHDTMRGKDANILSTFALHEVEVQEDIATYLKHRLSSRRVPQDIIDTLTELAGSLFIIASILVQFFTTGNIDARVRFELLKTSLPTQKLVLNSLDEFYQGILVTALHEGELMGIEIQGIKDVLFTVVCAHDPLSIQGLAGILDVSEEEISRRLDSLHSILYVPNRQDHPIIALHASLLDFIQSPSRSGRFHCYPKSFHNKTLLRCLAVLNKQLHQNLCQVVDLSSPASIKPDVTQSHISSSLRYAALFWLAHWELSDESLRQEAIEGISKFLNAHILHWLECLSLLSNLSVGAECLETMLNVLNEDTALTAMCHDAFKFVQLLYHVIECNPMNIYSHVLLWAPLDSPLRATNSALSQTFPHALCGLATDWPPLERTININSATITSIAISRDGKRMALGSYDSTVRIWNAQSRTEECTLTGHTDQIDSVAVVTEDGTRIASGSSDGTVRIWDTVNSKAVFTLQASGGVLAVAVSSNEKYVAGGDQNGYICVWNAENGQLLQLLDGHTDEIRSVAFIPNTVYLVSGSVDETARVWDVLTGETKSILRGHTDWVYSVACSPAGDRIITGSGDNTARLWSSSGRKLRVLRGHSRSNTVYAVAFMPDGKRVITGLDDHTLAVWDVDTGSTQRVFTATGFIRSIAAFPDGLKIASCSDDHIDIWSMRNVGALSTTSTNDSPIRTDHLVFSSDGKRALLLPSLQILDTATLEKKAVLPAQNSCHHYGVWSASRRRVAIADRNEVEVWELEDDDVIIQKTLIIKAHSKRITHVSFSHEERLLASTSEDRTACIWDATTGLEVLTLRHPHRVYSASFSHDNAKLVTSCRGLKNAEGSVDIWSAQTGEHWQMYRIDVNVFSAIFTPDDEYLITYERTTEKVAIFDARAPKLEHEHKGYRYWNTFSDGTSYALSTDGWICRFPLLASKPQKLIWIPLQYLPSEDNIYIRNNPLFTVSVRGVQVCLPRTEGLVTVLIPHEYLRDDSSSLSHAIDNSHRVCGHDMVDDLCPSLH